MFAEGVEVVLPVYVALRNPHPGEKDNLVDKQPRIATDLSKELGAYLRNVDAQRPTFKATGKPCP